MTQYGPKIAYECTGCECAKYTSGGSSDYGTGEYNCEAMPCRLCTGAILEGGTRIPEYPETPKWCPLMPVMLDEVTL